MRIWRLSAAVLLTAVLVATGIFVSGVVQASHSFSDVPTTAFYHNAVEWIVNRAITAGCAAGLYCPDDAVTRGQMAVFMRALGIALTPAFVRSGAGTGAVDPELNPVLCQTATFTPTGFPRQAFVQGWVSLNPAGSMSVITEIVVSTDGGTSWNNPETGPGFARAGADGAGEWFHLYKDALFNPTLSTNYMFGVRVSRESGVADATAHRCTVTAVIYNRNPTTSPLTPESAPRFDGN